MRFRDSRRAAIAIQFNWIFVIIIGGLIITFFYFAIEKHRGVAEISINTEVRTKLQTILTAGQQSTATTYAITIPNQELEFSCQGIDMGGLAPLKFQHAFAPTRLKSEKDRFIVSALPFSWPFKADNFLYVTSPDIRYIFYNDDDTNARPNLLSLMQDKENPSMPEGTTTEMVNETPAGQDCTSLSDENNYQVIFVFFANPTDNTATLTAKQKKCASTFAGMNPKDAKAIKIRPIAGSIDGRGVIYFYQMDSSGRFKQVTAPPNDGLPYLGRESILGAIISGDPDIFECGMKEALDRLQRVTYTYEKEANILSEYLKNENNCYSYLDDAKAILTTFGGLAGADNYPGSDELQSLYGTMNRIANKNKLLALHSCPLIY
ncbi:MAG: hypothetical protein GXP63_03210 [DPANN group archaeon]|nr:hypothetical protein [DPANN group archaeon]